MKITAEDLVEVPVEQLVRGEQYFVSDYGAKEALFQGVRTYEEKGRTEGGTLWIHWYELRQQEPNLDGLEIDFREWKLWCGNDKSRFMDELIDNCELGFKYTLRRRVNPRKAEILAEIAKLEQELKELKQ